jgi:hypothetical protein
LNSPALGREAERLVVLVALGGEVHLPGHGLEHRAELPRRFDSGVTRGTIGWPGIDVVGRRRDRDRHGVDDELVATVARILPRLSSSPPPSAEHLRAIVDGPDTACSSPASTAASSAC